MGLTARLRALAYFIEWIEIPVNGIPHGREATPAALASALSGRPIAARRRVRGLPSTRVSAPGGVPVLHGRAPARGTDQPPRHALQLHVPGAGRARVRVAVLR